MKLENVTENEVTYMVLKTDEGYFEDAWEDVYCEEDEENYGFTDSIENAYKFYGGMNPKWGNAPKYLWNDLKCKSIDTLQQAQEYLGGEVFTVTKTIRTITTFDIEKL